MSRLIDRILSGATPYMMPVGFRRRLADGIIPLSCFGAEVWGEVSSRGLTWKESMARNVEPEEKFKAIDPDIALKNGLLKAQSHIFECSNVLSPYLDYVKKAIARGDSTAEYSDLVPKVAPPFENFWMEFHNKEVGDRQLHGLTFGAYCRAETSKDLIKKILNETLEMNEGKIKVWDMQAEDDMRKLDPSYYLNTLMPNTKWVLYLHLFVEHWDRSQCDGPVATSMVPIDNEGKILKCSFLPSSTEPFGYMQDAVVRMSHNMVEPDSFQGPDGIGLTMGNYPNIYKRISSDVKAASHAIEEFLVPFFFSLGMMNCRNIHAVSVTTPPKVAKKFKKKKKTDHDLVVYKVLKIGSVSASTSNGQSTKTGEKLRGHIARGHWKNYTEDKPLFGKLVGTYWWESQFRGSKKKGVVIKDYELEPKKEGGTNGEGTSK